MANYCVKCKKKIGFFNDYWVDDKHYHKKCWESIPQRKGKEEKLKGLGGWLILVQIGLWLSIIINPYILIFASNSLIRAIYLILNFLLCGFTLFFMYSKSKKFKKFAIAEIILSILYGIITEFVFIFILPFFLIAEGEYYSAFGLLLFDCIFFGISIAWILYFIKSKRVKNTFLR